MIIMMITTTATATATATTMITVSKVRTTFTTSQLFPFWNHSHVREFFEELHKHVVYFFIIFETHLGRLAHVEGHVPVNNHRFIDKLPRDEFVQGMFLEPMFCNDIVPPC